MKKILIAMLVTATMVLTGCSSKANNDSKDTPDIIASTNVYGNIAQTIAGDHLKVQSLINDPNQDPHEFQASSQDKLAISKAKLVIANGSGYDDFADQMVNSVSDKKPKMVKVSDQYQGKEDNEHYWYNMAVMDKLVDKLEAEFTEIDPAHTEDFQNNAKKLKAQIAKVHETEQQIKKTHSGQGVLITEPVPLYMLEDAGLVNKTPEDFSKAVENGSEVPAQVLNQTLNLANPKTVKLLAYNSQTMDDQSDKLKAKADETKLPAIGFTETLPEGKDYGTWMQENVDSIQKALGN
ncbi:MAG: zinc ABC transporter substrate-binding protein [Micrococcaceae bacterium]